MSPKRVSTPREPTCTKDPGSRAAGVATAFTLIESAPSRGRAVNAPHLVALVRAGAKFEKGETGRTTRTNQAPQVPRPRPRFGAIGEVSAMRKGAQFAVHVAHQDGCVLSAGRAGALASAAGGELRMCWPLRRQAEGRRANARTAGRR